jgi:hypothetical protein
MYFVFTPVPWIEAISKGLSTNSFPNVALIQVLTWVGARKSHLLQHLFWNVCQEWDRNIQTSSRPMQLQMLGPCFDCVFENDASGEMHRSDASVHLLGSSKSRSLLIDTIAAQHFSSSILLALE